MLQINPQICPADHACPLVRICPVQAISQQGIGLPVIDTEKCIDCGKCALACPMGAVDEV